MVFLGVFFITKLLVTINDVHKGHFGIRKLRSTEESKCPVLINPRVFLEILVASLKCKNSALQFSFF